MLRSGACNNVSDAVTNQDDLMKEDADGDHSTVEKEGKRKNKPRKQNTPGKNIGEGMVPPKEELTINIQYVHVS